MCCRCIIPPRVLFARHAGNATQIFQQQRVCIYTRTHKHIYTHTYTAYIIKELTFGLLITTARERGREREARVDAFSGHGFANLSLHQEADDRVYLSILFYLLVSSDATDVAQM